MEYLDHQGSLLRVHEQIDINLKNDNALTAFLDRVMVVVNVDLEMSL